MKNLHLVLASMLVGTSSFAADPLTFTDLATRFNAATDTIGKMNDATPGVPAQKISNILWVGQCITQNELDQNRVPVMHAGAFIVQAKSAASGAWSETPLFEASPVRYPEAAPYYFMNLSLSQIREEMNLFFADVTMMANNTELTFILLDKVTLIKSAHTVHESGPFLYEKVIASAGQPTFCIYRNNGLSQPKQ